MNRIFRPSCALRLLATLLLSLSVHAQVPWPHPDGTAHWYEVVVVDGGISWHDAQAAARSAGGHLASITSTAENAFVFSLVDADLYWVNAPVGHRTGPWIGGVLDGSWKWLRGEPFAMNAWAAGEPSGAPGEDRIHYTDLNEARSSSWADGDGTQPLPKAYVIEWEWAPDQTMGHLQTRPGSWGDYTIFGSAGFTFLVDQDGNAVNFWQTNWPNGFTPYLQDNGDLLRLMNTGSSSWAGGASGRIERRDWNGNLVWSYDLDTPGEITHHDVATLPNGNVLFLVWERKTQAQAIAQGRDPASLLEGELWPERVIEVQPSFPSGGTVVWEWNLWDHLVQDFDSNLPNYGVVADHPELVDINYTQDGIADWCHANSLDYSAQLDQIVISVRSFNEIWVIDHSTTTAEAASHSGGARGKGGDLLYRWGNPEAYDRGGPQDLRLFRQHDAQWIKPGLPGAGNLLLFNNGDGRPGGNWSSVDEITAPVDAQGNYILNAGMPFGPSSATATHHTINPSDFYASYVSGCQRLPNGNTFFAGGALGRFFEQTPSGEIVWEYINPNTMNQGILAQSQAIGNCGPGLCNMSFRALRLAATHPGLVGKNLESLGPIEAYAPEMRARFGTVNQGNQVGAADVLRVNGSRGDVWRRVYVDGSQPLTISVDAPPAGPTPSGFAIYAAALEVGLIDLELQPYGIGTAVMPMPLASGLPTLPVIALSNSLGFEAMLGLPALPTAPPAPTTIYNGTMPPGSFTLQGYILDSGANTPAGLSLTNAVVIHVF